MQLQSHNFAEFAKTHKSLFHSNLADSKVCLSIYSELIFCTKIREFIFFYDRALFWPQIAKKDVSQKPDPVGPLHTNI